MIPYICKIMAKVVCKAALRAGPEMLVDFIPGGNIAKGFIDVAVDLVQEIYNANDSANIMQELSKIPAANNPDEYSIGLHSSLQEFAANCTPDEQKLLQLPKTQILFIKFIDMFAAMPKHCRRQNARKDDPYGTTLRKDFNLNSSDDLKLIFPPISEYHHGMKFHGGWILDCPLGKGSFGEVWKAHHVDAPTAPMALKICSDPRGRISLKREVGLIRTIKSKLKSCKGISHLLSESIDADPPHLVYEYIDGGDLVPVIYDLKKFLSIRDRTVQAAKIIIEIAQTLATLHKMNPPIVHRDIKPSNILVRKSAIRNRFVITDFGIGCLQFGTTSVDSSLGGTIVGDYYTEKYASPEQIEGEKSHPKDDVHALGVVFYQMLRANIKDIPGPSFDRQLKKQGVDIAIIQVINSMIEEEREERVGSLLEVISQLRDILGLKEKQIAKKIAKLSHLGNYSWPSGTGSHWNNIVVSGATESDLKNLLQQNGLPDRIGLKNLLAKSNMILPTASDVHRSLIENPIAIQGRGVPVRECPDRLYYPTENTFKYPEVGSPIALIALDLLIPFSS